MSFDWLSSLLLVHDDSELLDALTRIFEARGFDVAVAATALSAWSQLDSDRKFDVVIAGWEATRPLGAEVYSWVLETRYHLRTQFVFLAEDPPDDFDRLIQGRCLLLDPYDFEEVVRVTEATALRTRVSNSRMLSLDRADTLVSNSSDSPSLLLVEDEPLQLTVMRMALSRAGFAVTPVESGNDAIAELGFSDYDVILSDWYMANGSGADLYDWLVEHRPHLAPRCVFMSASNPAECKQRAPGRPVVAKGQDSPALFHRLKSIVGVSRAPAGM